MPETISLVFDGLDAETGKIDLYDLSLSQYGLARVVAILGHYYQTGRIVSQAPRSDVRVYAYPPEDGSFKQTVAAGVIATVLGVPFSVFLTRVINDWVPNPDPQMQQVIDLLKEQNQMLRRQQGLPPMETPQERQDNEQMNTILKEREEELLVLRSITANSFKDVFRPIGRSAQFLSIAAGDTKAPVTAINPAAVALIESERKDPEVVRVIGVVNSFSRSSKTGYIFSQKLGRGIHITDVRDGALPPRDDYSWSQFSRNPLEMTGSYVYWFDGRIKRLLVDKIQRLYPDRE